MSDIFQIAGIGMLAGQQRLEAISLNAASASQPGYRRRVALLGRAFEATLAAPPTATSGAATGSSAVDLRPGAMTATGRALDMAIDGDAVFFGLTDGTHTWLTRAGSFRLDETGVLVGERGLRVIGMQGDVRLPGTDVEVSADGHITRQGASIAALQFFQPNDRASLQAAQGSLLVAPGGVRTAEAGQARLRSGALEASNTDATREMLDLMSLSRQFESLGRIVQGYDDVLGRAIQKLGEI